MFGRSWLVRTTPKLGRLVTPRILSSSTKNPNWERMSAPASVRRRADDEAHEAAALWQWIWRSAIEITTVYFHSCHREWQKKDNANKMQFVQPFFSIFFLLPGWPSWSGVDGLHASRAHTLGPHHRGSEDPPRRQPWKGQAPFLEWPQISSILSRVRALLTQISECAFTV